MYRDLRTQKPSGLSFDSVSVWITASSEMRKNPKSEGLGGGVFEGEATETELSCMVTWPVRVKPNRSKRMIGRESESIVKDLISARADGIVMRSRRRTAETSL